MNGIDINVESTVENPEKRKLDSLGGLRAPSKRGFACAVAAMEPIVFGLGGMLRLPDLTCRYSDEDDDMVLLMGLVVFNVGLLLRVLLKLPKLLLLLQLLL